MIGDIATHCGVTLKTLNQVFNTHLTWSPSVFRRVSRFKKVLQGIKDQDENAKLIDITYDLNFSDQSHMIREFRSFTRMSPKNFFKKLFAQSRGNTHWTFS